MKRYINESLKKFNNDALSKGIYDLIKWLVVSLILLIPTNWIPVVKCFLSSKHQVSIYGIIIFSVVLVILTIIIVSRIFRRRILQVQKDNYTDELTGLKNHKALKNFLNLKIKEFKSKNESLSIIIIDIDNFKNFNTEFGFNTADNILKKVGELLSNDKRATDETFRQFLRGDEFLVIASETNLNDALLAAERKRKLIQNALFSVDGKNHTLTVSCGVTEFKKETDNFTSFTDRVIEALNEAKKMKGKNCSKSII